MAQYLPYLVFLLCPISMGVMVRGGRGAVPQPPIQDPRISDLESEMDELRAEVRERSRQESGSR